MAAGQAHPRQTLGLILVEDARALAEDGQGRRWIGTNQGLVLLEPRRAPRWFTVASGHLNDDWVTALHTQGDRVWVGTYARLVFGMRDHPWKWLTKTYVSFGTTREYVRMIEEVGFVDVRAKVVFPGMATIWQASSP